ncbi:uncharacterized protein K489DRAFT_368021 [Dissoconium aciculare CBS 342.82]|uniref:PD-(D/E)XK nuclease-like domain-containing protein n=1 Tax=Dissoconium aciculare CBS 342.82 TaxID=1314786 RepID=A0A6J3MAW8_9PEZI|nr:uncharacterized protein K489DRAFT_368021 [Dissoconium aciculare CBS 342.82]KAF1824779.1 hypothetical protein K489DRAFT_368021 [Dissoconium aciculare CBS 342.82]
MARRIQDWIAEIFDHQSEAGSTSRHPFPPRRTEVPIMPRSKEKGAKAGAGSTSSAGAQKSGHHQKGKISPEATASQGPSKASGTSPKGSIVERLHSLTHRPKAPASPPATNVEEGHVVLEAKASVVAGALQTSGTKSTQEQDDESKYESEDDSIESQRSDPKDKSYHGSKGSGSVHDRETRASRNSSTNSLLEQHGIGGLTAASKSMPSIRSLESFRQQIESARSAQHNRRGSRTSSKSVRSVKSSSSVATTSSQTTQTFTTLPRLDRPIQPGQGSEFQPTWDAYEQALVNSILRVVRGDDIKISKETFDAILLLEPVEAYQFSDVKATAPPENLRGTISAADIRILQFVLDQTKFCHKTRALEAGWNSQVHGILLQLAALGSTCEVNMHNVTTQMQGKQAMRPKHYGTPQTISAVDFMFMIPVEARSHEQALIFILPEESGNPYNSFNTHHHGEIGVMFVETKRARGDQAEGLVQNALAVDAQIRWLHELVRLMQYFDQKQYPAQKDAQNSKLPKMPALPSLLVMGSEWYIQLSKQDESGGLKTLFYELNDGQALADTKTLFGIVKVLEIQFALLKYIEEVWEPWLIALLRRLPSAEVLSDMALNNITWKDLKQSKLSPITEAHE